MAYYLQCVSKTGHLLEKIWWYCTRIVWVICKCSRCPVFWDTM